MLGEAFGWNNIEELLSVIAELIDLNNRLFIQAHSKQGAPKPPAIEIPRPNRPKTSSDTPKKASADEISQFFAGHIKTPESN